jgi:hypothetical protein
MEAYLSNVVPGFFLGLNARFRLFVPLKWIFRFSPYPDQHSQNHKAFGVARFKIGIMLRFNCRQVKYFGRWTGLVTGQHYLFSNTSSGSVIARRLLPEQSPGG